MLKKISVVVILFAALIVLVACQNGDDSGEIIFYYSLTCPHCKNVDKYIEDNKVKDKVRFVSKEVSQNKNNAASFMDKVARCGIKPEEAGVPLLWDGSNCILGDEKIINYFFSEISK